MNNINVLHITECYDGGIKTFLDNISQNHNKKINNFFLVISKKNYLKKNHYFYKSRSRLYSTLLLFIILPYYINIVKPRIIHSHSSIAGFVIRFYSLIYVNTKFFYQPHGLVFFSTKNIFLKKIFYYYEKIFSFFPCTIIACSKSEFNQIKTFSKKKILLINNGVLVSEKYYKKKNNKFIRIVSIGRLCYQKNPELFLKVRNYFIKNNKIKFIWIGGGEYKNMKNMFKKCKIEITGWVNQNKVNKILKTSDIFILLSRYEGMPFSILHAQSNGLPSVVTNVVGNKDLIINNFNGFKTNNYKKILEYILLLCKNKNLRRQLSKNSHYLVKHKFNLNNQLSRLYSYYSI